MIDFITSHSRTFIVSALALLLILTFYMYKTAIDISVPLPAKAYENSASSVPSDKKVINFGVISRFSPQILYKGYQPVIDYLNANTPYHFELKLSSNYEESVIQLASGNVDLAFLGSYIYVRDRDKYHLKCILKPLDENGRPFFHSALVTRDSSVIFSVSDLCGKRLALPSPLSFSGNWLIPSELKKYNIKKDDLQEVAHFPYHHMVIHQILKGRFDAGVVKDRVAREFISAGIRIFGLSEPIPGSPIVVRTDCDSQLIDAVSQALLRVDPKHPDFREIIEAWDEEFVYGFAPASDSDYDLLESYLKDAPK